MQCFQFQKPDPSCMSNSLRMLPGFCPNLLRWSFEDSKEFFEGNLELPRGSYTHAKVGLLPFSACVRSPFPSRRHHFAYRHTRKFATSPHHNAFHTGQTSRHHILTTQHVMTQGRCRDIKWPSTTLAKPTQLTWLDAQVMKWIHTHWFQTHVLIININAICIQFTCGAHLAATKRCRRTWPSQGGQRSVIPEAQQECVAIGKECWCRITRASWLTWWVYPT